MTHKIAKKNYEYLIFKLNYRKQYIHKQILRKSNDT